MINTHDLLLQNLHTFVEDSSNSFGKLWIIKGMKNFAGQ